MRLTSLRSKIFLLVGITLLAGAAVVMLVTQRDVTSTVVASEEVAVRNVLNLLMKDSEARWGSLLSDKISTVRNGREHLVQLGATLESVLSMYARQVESGTLSQSAAQDLARDWIDRQGVHKQRYSFVFDSKLTAIASANPDMRGVNLSNIKDFKGNALAATAYQEARTTGQSFGIYRLATSGDAGKEEPGKSQLRYAYFGHFEPWDWIFAVTDDAQAIVTQFDLRRKEMEASISEVMNSLRLAESGFAFIVKADDTLLSPLPAAQTGLLDAQDATNGKTLRQLLAAAPADGQILSLHFDPAGDPKPWQISAAHFKPLGWTIIAAVPAEDLTRAATDLRNRLGWVFLLVLLASLGVAWALSVRLTRPLQQLSDFARALPEQDLSTASPIPEHIKRLPAMQPDEVGRLAATFIFMDQQLREKIVSLLRETSSRERFESELNIARDIQMGLLPIPLASTVLEKIDLYATMIPAKEVGGDLYDYFLLADGRLCFAIGDVSDKGVPAALFMAVTRTLIRASAEDESDPARLMERVNNRLSENNPNVMFVTLVLAVLDLATGDLEWANGGHPPLCVVTSHGELRLLEGRSGPACGVQDGLTYRTFSTRLEPGETLLGYTDGITEAVGPDGSLYEEQRLFRQLKDVHHSGAKELADGVLQDVQQFVQQTEQSDDITLIAVKRSSP
ncbi:HAMP domain-containing protein [Candidimonas sp. SYP-B2681]|uniref:SpoIIE family protein phosphatase n=1 Tax=Candidimonas sp. SYP-B2681 TaxID=2497686 RepID=UPI000F882A4D|nr:SpoIIE family protein phosphatase [Candidimonas sp. SYP-B2681]RTZ39776.1 HAMP domain-containing protein [Candidimonas sp. SYP-B2681]